MELSRRLSAEIKELVVAYVPRLKAFAVCAATGDHPNLMDSLVRLALIERISVAEPRRLFE
jgi:hypothetical protein